MLIGALLGGGMGALIAVSDEGDVFRAAARGAGFTGSTAGIAHYARPGCASVPGPTGENGSEWVPQMVEILGINPGSLPVIWDADFRYGPRDAAGVDSYVLCEINVSSCFAIPDDAPAAIAKLALARCQSIPNRSR